MSGIKRIGWHGVHGMKDDDSGDYVLHSDHEAEVARLRAEVEEYRKDAERYRWIRSPFATSIESLIGMHCLGELDYQIDKAMGDPA